ncbi:MAG: DNA recombination protein RmuC [Deltaproteobacteria bacterium]|jgi:DNA recombination protein RmuC|nr:DNA recombination protein RmuC [Deltaproteobacteria bacterium]
MSGVGIVLVAVAALVAGALLGWLLSTARERARGEARLREIEGTARAGQATAEELRRSLGVAEDRAASLATDLGEAQKARTIAETRNAELRRWLDEQKALLDSAEAKLCDTFRALAAQALAANNEGFLTLATEKLGAARQETDAALAARQTAIDGMLKPVKESLDRVDAKMAEIERERGQAYGRLTELLRSLGESQSKLSSETGNLVRALRAPATRGRWGEIQLKRVVELAGMLEHCDFVQQETLSGEDGRLRPDMIVKLAGGREIVVDAKVPLEAYLGAIEADTDEARQAHLARHAEQVRAHVLKLSAKSYWSELPGTPEFVLMFLPSEAMYGAALQEQPALLEEGVARKVLVATPMTLIALLRAAHYGWHEERLAKSAQEISEQGRELHVRLASLFEHWVKLGSALGKATDSYNQAVGALERRVRPAIRKLEDLGARSEKEPAVLEEIATRPRVLLPEETAPPALPPEGE